MSDDADVPRDLAAELPASMQVIGIASPTPVYGWCWGSPTPTQATGQHAEDWSAYPTPSFL